MIADSVAFMKERVEVVFDAEHFTMVITQCGYLDCQGDKRRRGLDRALRANGGALPNDIRGAIA
jgi:hypothetical protein